MAQIKEKVLFFTGILLASLFLAFPAQGVNIVSDSSMEEAALVPWVQYGQPAVLEKSAGLGYEGSQALHVQSGANGKGGFQHLTIPVEAGKTYTYSFRYRLTQGAIKTWLGIQNSNVAFDNKVETLHFEDDGWKQFSREFTVPADYTNGFRILISTQQADALIDDVQIEQVIEALVQDGDMEKHTSDAWISYNNPFVKEKTQDAHAGSYSMHIVTPRIEGQVRNISGIEQRNLAVETGKTYTLSFWYKVSGSLLPRLSINSSGEDFELALEPGVAPILSSTQEWTHYERTFTVPENFAGDFRLVFALFDIETSDDWHQINQLPQGEAFIDDVSITRVEQEPPQENDDQNNGGNENNQQPPNEDENNEDDPHEENPQDPQDNENPDENQPENPNNNGNDQNEQPQEGNAGNNGGNNQNQPPANNEQQHGNQGNGNGAQHNNQNHSQHNSGGGGGAIVVNPPTVKTPTQTKNGGGTPTTPNPIVVNSGTATTTSRVITLTFQIENAVHMALSENEDFSNVSFEPFATSTRFKLSPGYGEKTIHARFRSQEGGTVTFSQTLERVRRIGVSRSEVGGTPPQVEQEISHALHTQKQAQQCVLPTNQIYTDIKTGVTYFISATCSKQVFSSQEVIDTYTNLPPFLSTSEILNQIPLDTFKFVPIGPKYQPKTGELLKTPDDPRVYLIVESKKYWIKTEEIFLGLGFDWKKIKTAGPELMNTLAGDGIIG